MKKFFFALLSVVALLATSCSNGFDDSEIWDKLNSLEERVAALEQLCKQMNTNITSLQTIVDALQKNDYVTNVAPINEGGDVVGYTITFAKGDSITIYLSGNASAPQIGVKKHSDGIYYWTLGGEWLLDDEGNKVKAQGNMPKLKVENEYWYVSYDNGASWSEIGEATSDDGDSMFTDVTYDEDYVYLTLSDGTTLVLPRSADFTDIPNNQIWYTSTNGNVITPYSSNVFGANIVSNVYEDGKGIITFDGDVTEIGEGAFYECLSLESITLPDRVKMIGDFAFCYCEALESITLSAGVTSIGEYAFYDCYVLTSITMPEGVQSIGEYAFEGCVSLESITLGSVTEIGRYAFNYCTSLESITIPNSVTSIGMYAFANCSSLESLTIPNSVTSIGKYAFEYCTSLTAFYGKFASVDNRCLIVDGKLLAFAPAGLTSYTIPNGVTSVGGHTFRNCDALECIILPEGVASIGDMAFYGCDALSSITLPDSVTEIGDGAFARCFLLKSINIPDSVTLIGDYAFNACLSLTAFYGKYASADNRCLTVDGKLLAFARAGLTSYTIPNGVTSIGEEVFSYCNALSSITLPDSVTEIGIWAFYYCTSLESIILPESVTEIGIWAFEGCSSLATVYSKPATPPALGSDVFENAPLSNIYVPTSSVSAYKTAGGWSSYASIIEGYTF